MRFTNGNRERKTSARVRLFVQKAKKCVLLTLRRAFFNRLTVIFLLVVLFEQSNKDTLISMGPAPVRS